ncbi:MAG: cytochrome [Thermoleophilaceae bacterium]|jgi:mono/diheme cytochrome c family protein|nr:cytochrome [Thermoleophilaceae bacterium]MEA2400688.1 cytochrome [Thermoleophilaceae bacterium]
MEVLLVIGPFLALGIVVMFIAFSGSPGAAREAYLTRGGRAFTVAIVLLYVGLGVAVPAAVIAARGESEGGVGSLRTEQASASDEEGKELFISTCKSCHNLDAVQATGVTGPDLDELGGLDRQRVLNAIKNGGTGQDRMPAGLLQGEDAEAVARYVARVAGR